MKNVRLKSLAAALAVVGFATACDRNTAQRDAYVPPEPPPIERSTTADGTTSPDALQSLENDPYASSRMTTSAADIDHEETVQFSGTELTDASEEKLEDLVEALDKEKPVAVIVAMEESSADVSETTNTSAATTPPNSNMPADTGTADRDMANTEANPAETEHGAEFAQRVDRVREFLQEQGIEVVHWQFEGTTQNYQATNQQAEDIQQVRIVIAESMTTEKLGSL